MPNAGTWCGSAGGGLRAARRVVVVAVVVIAVVVDCGVVDAVRLANMTRSS